MAMAVQVPLAVATLQKKVLWRGEVTLSNGSKQSGWEYSLTAERNVGAHTDLVPDREPDTAARVKWKWDEVGQSLYKLGRLTSMKPFHS